MKTIVVTLVASLLGIATPTKPSMIVDTPTYQPQVHKHSLKLEQIKNKQQTALAIVPISSEQFVQNEASKMGWDSGNEWQALKQLVFNESTLSPQAQNPESTAYGMFQFLDSTWALVGCQKTSNAKEQSRCGMLYIKKIYGTPSQALAKWQSRSPHWY